MALNNSTVSTMTSDSNTIPGIYVICASSILSNAAATGVILWILAQKQINQTVSRLVLNLMFADWMQSVGFMMSLNWIAQSSIETNLYCTLQGIFINFGDVASGLMVTAICLHTYMEVVHFYQPKWFFRTSIMLIWSFSLCTSIAGIFFQTPGIPFYGDAGGMWCWISSHYSLYRILFHYGIILILLIIIIVLYGIMFSFVYQRNKSISTKCPQRVLDKTGKRLIFYPVIYFFLVFPLALHRVLLYMGVKLPRILIAYSVLLCDDCSLTLAGTIFTSAGLANSAIYGFTRHVVTMKPMFEHHHKRLSQKIHEEIITEPNLPMTDTCLESSETFSLRGNMSIETINIEEAQPGTGSSYKFPIHRNSDFELMQEPAEISYDESPSYPRKAYNSPDRRSLSIDSASQVSYLLSHEPLRTRKEF
ncbi:hypothetical protein G9A89_023139 [Geosiphon pyriformis]|nr:hypothetical protein G9A89_023139 [Geosiphon pyriformis]